MFLLPRLKVHSDRMRCGAVRRRAVTCVRCRAALHAVFCFVIIMLTYVARRMRYTATFCGTVQCGMVLPARCRKVLRGTARHRNAPQRVTVRRSAGVSGRYQRVVLVGWSAENIITVVAWTLCAARRARLTDERTMGSTGTH